MNLSNIGIVDEPDDPVGTLISQCVINRLLELRLRARPGNSQDGINRMTARYLNSFESDRVNTQTFVGVQETSTIERYGMFWSQLILFLLRIQLHERSTLDNRLMKADPGGSLGKLLDEAQHAGEVLAGSNTQRLSFTDCLNDQAGLPTDTAKRRSDARTLRVAVDRLSIALVQQYSDGSAFSLYVVAYSATRTLDKHGAWYAADEYRPFLSGMIHCMQLWLLSHCLQQQMRQDPPSTLQDLVRAQCQLYMVNTTPGPIAELSCWRLLCHAARNDNPRPPVTTLTDDCMVVNHADVELRLPQWRKALETLLREAANILNDTLLFGLQGLADYPVESLHDNMAERRPGLSFLDDPRNQLHTVRDNVLQHLFSQPDLRRRFFLAEAPPTSESGAEQQQSQSVRINPAEAAGYSHANKQFLQLLAVLIVMTAGLPPRRKELLGVSWCNDGNPRNVFIYDGLVALITTYHKSQWRVGSRPVARFLPPYLGNVLVRYLIYIPPVLRFLDHCSQAAPPRGLLFSTGEVVWHPDRLSAAMTSLTRQTMGISVRYRQWRHMAIALDRRLLQGVGCQAHGVDTDPRGNPDDSSDSDLDADHRSHARPRRIAGNAHHWQAAHTTNTNVSHYGNSSAPVGHLTDTLLAEFCSVSRQFHQLAHVQAFEATANDRKRPGSPSAEPSYREKRSSLLASRFHLRQKLWTWPAVERGLKVVFGPTAIVRDRTQREALLLLASWTPESIIVLPTGGGKSTLYLVMSCLQAADVTIVIVPLIALRQDLIRRCREAGIPYWHYNNVDRMEERLHAVPPLVFVDVESATTKQFVAFLQQLHHSGRVDRLVLDEAHLVLTSTPYRANLGWLGTLRQVPCPFVCLTATLPPHGVLELNQSLHLRNPTVQRVSSDRPNLAYSVQSLENSAPPISSALQAPRSADDRLVHAVTELCRQDVRQWRAGSPHDRATARGLCFVRQKQMGTWLAQSLDCEFYHAGLPACERASILTAWSQGGRSPFLVATSALGAGVDCPSVRRVIHVDAPEGLVAYGQETGRAGRDGMPADCTIILPPKWSVGWDRCYRSNFLDQDVAFMTSYLRTQHCLRQLLTNYLDGSLGGRDGIACNEDDGIARVRCQNCHLAAAEQTLGNVRPEPQQPPPIVGSAPTVPTVHAPGMPTSPPPRMHRGAPDGTESSDQGYSPMDLSQESEHPPTTVGSEGATAPDPTIPAEEVLQAAARLVHLQCMQAADAEALYHERLARWGRACILCSFLQRELVPYPHPDCAQVPVDRSLTAFRRTIRFASGVGCFRCGQPRSICEQSGKKGCQYPWFVFHCCWVAVERDTTYAVDLIRTLGGPDLAQHASAGAVAEQQSYLRWLGDRGQRVFDRVPAWNATRLALFWIDRLEALLAEDEEGPWM